MPLLVSPPEVYDHVTDEPTALHIHAVFGLAEREIGFVEALFSSLVYSFWKHVQLYWPTICDQIENGRLTWGHEPGWRHVYLIQAY
jgi:GH3 auxin-responsive promoter